MSKNKHSELSQRIRTQFVLSFFALVAGLFFLYFLFRYLCSLVVWYENDPVYDFLKMCEALSPFLAAIFLIIGLYLITRHFLNLPLYYLDEVIEASKGLSQPEKNPIVLPNAIKDVENELNLIRESALRNAYAAKEADQRKNDLIVYLAHDLKTPLTSIIGYLSLLSDEKEISKSLQEKYIHIALTKSLRLEDLINEFFDITRFNLSNITLNYATINLSRMLEQICYEFGPSLAEKNLTIEPSFAKDISLSCDPDKFERVIDNLIRNAISYSYPDTTISLSLTTSGDNIRLTLSNHGKTIPQEKLSHIFEQFFRLDSARSTNNGGSGLGLAISKKIVELHNGSIEVESKDEQITFSITLPIK